MPEVPYRHLKMGEGVPTLTQQQRSRSGAATPELIFMPESLGGLACDHTRSCLTDTVLSGLGSAAWTEARAIAS
jgi:hypothetical protein